MDSGGRREPLLRPGAVQPGAVLHQADAERRRRARAALGARQPRRRAARADHERPAVHARPALRQPHPVQGGVHQVPVLGRRQVGGLAGAAGEGVHWQAPGVVAGHQVLHQLRVPQGKGRTVPRCPRHHGAACVREGELQLPGSHRADHDKAEAQLHL